MQAWRLVRDKYMNVAFSGEGAAKYGGRWNSPGTFMVYASSSLSLAALEVLIHFIGSPLLPYCAFKIEFDDKLITVPDPKDLPANWRSEPPVPATMRLGDDWTKSATSAVLAVPSILVPVEANYLFNPLHPDFKKIKISEPQHYTFDPRLLKQKKTDS
jgi:RES domain-containing protein